MLLALEEKLFQAIKSKNEQEVCQILVEFKKTNELLEENDVLKNNIKKPSLERFNSEGRTPLVEAVFTGNVKILKALIDAGAKVDGQAINSSTPLMFAAQKDFHHCVDLLIKANADPNLQGQLKRTPLMWAAEASAYASLIILLEAGANRNLKDSEGASAASYASNDCYDLLNNSQFMLPTEMKLFKAVALNNLQLLEETIQEMNFIHEEFKKHPYLDKTLAPKINVKNRKGETPLLFASMLGHRECAEVISAEVNRQSPKPVNPPVKKKNFPTLSAYLKSISFFEKKSKPKSGYAPVREESESKLNLLGSIN